jgi:hypothetical protein
VGWWGIRPPPSRQPTVGLALRSVASNLRDFKFQPADPRAIWLVPALDLRESESAYPAVFRFPLAGLGRAGQRKRGGGRRRAPPPLQRRHTDTESDNRFNPTSSLSCWALTGRRLRRSPPPRDRYGRRPGPWGPTASPPSPASLSPPSTPACGTPPDVPVSTPLAQIPLTGRICRARAGPCRTGSGRAGVVARRGARFRSQACQWAGSIPSFSAWPGPARPGFGRRSESPQFQRSRSGPNSFNFGGLGSARISPVSAESDRLEFPTDFSVNFSGVGSAAHPTRLQSPYRPPGSASAAVNSPSSRPAPPSQTLRRTAPAPPPPPMAPWSGPSDT